MIPTSQTNGRSRPVSRVLSPRFLASPREADIPLGLPLPAGSSELPGSATGRRCRWSGCSPICPCTRWGLPCPRCHHRGGALLPHRFTLTDFDNLSSAVCSLWRCPASRLGWSLTSTLPCGARTFLPCADLARTGVRPDGSDRAGVYRKRERATSVPRVAATAARRSPGCSSRPRLRSAPGARAAASPCRSGRAGREPR